FASIRNSCAPLVQALSPCRVEFLPISALNGDNVVSRGRMTWFTGPTLLEYLEAIPVREENDASPFRLPVQTILHQQRANEPIVAGKIASGAVTVGDEVLMLPSGQRSRVVALPAYGGDQQ